jgi:hypothetical protein
MLNSLNIRVVCNWSSTEEITKRLITQFSPTDNVDGLNFVYDDNYDLLVVFGYLNINPVKGTPIIIFPQEPTWSGGHPKTFGNLENLRVYGYDKKNYYQNDIVTELVSHMFYGGRGPWEEGYDFWNYNNLINNVFDKEKDFCSFVSNRGIDDVTHPEGCLYGERVGLVQNIKDKNVFIDFYGWGDEKNLKPFTRRKGDVIHKYKFCLTVENSSEHNFISEKFYDCILTNTIPIYYGCTNIKNIWPENGYILLENIVEFDEIVDKLNWIYERKDELYNDMLPELLKMKKRYFEEFNLITKIKNFAHEL